MKKWFANLSTKNIKLYAIFTYGITLLAAILVAYYFLPILLNYAPGSINTDFDKIFSSGFTYFTQFVVIYLAIFSIEIVWILWNLRDFHNLDTLVEDAKTSKAEQDRLTRVTKKALTLPFHSFILLAVLPSIILTIAFIAFGFTSFADMKVLFVVFSLSLLAGTLTHLASKGIFKQVLVSLHNTMLYEDTKRSLTPMIMCQIVPIFVLCIFYTFLLSYSSALEDKSVTMQHYYTDVIYKEIEDEKPQTVEELKELLLRLHFLSEQDNVFLIDEKNQFDNFKQVEVSDFFRLYALQLARQYGNRIYDYYGSELQGTLIPVTIEGKDMMIAIRYDLTNQNLQGIFINLFLLLVLSFFISHNFASSVTKDISLVTSSINNLLQQKENSTDQKLPVTSSDELGELLVAFNDVQELTKESITEIKNSEQSLMEKERLASLGEMIGGIAHNMKTPIMSIAGASEGLTELVSEYRASIDNPIVTKEDHKAIAQDMLDWITKIKTHTAYMSDIITAVKGQASQLSASENENFTLYDLSKRVEILIKHEIKKALLVLDIELQCDPSITLHGDINNLIQVVNNLITNSIDSYQGEPNQHIKFILNATETEIILTVADQGCGIPEDIQDKLFKQMYTTKGKKGTGLGLYMSYSTIRGKFNGNMTFTSHEGKGTIFTITIPRKNS